MATVCSELWTPKRRFPPRGFFKIFIIDVWPILLIERNTFHQCHKQFCQAVAYVIVFLAFHSVVPLGNCDSQHFALFPARWNQPDELVWVWIRTNRFRHTYNRIPNSDGLHVYIMYLFCMEYQWRNCFCRNYLKSGWFYRKTPTCIKNRTACVDSLPGSSFYFSKYVHVGWIWTSGNSIDSPERAYLFRA